MLISHHLEVGEKRKLLPRGRVVALTWYQVHRLILFSLYPGVKMGASELIGIT